MYIYSKSYTIFPAQFDQLSLHRRRESRKKSKIRVRRRTYLLACRKVPSSVYYPKNPNRICVPADRWAPHGQWPIGWRRLQSTLALTHNYENSLLIWSSMMTFWIGVCSRCLGVCDSRICCNGLPCHLSKFKQMEISHVPHQTRPRLQGGAHDHGITTNSASNETI